MNKSWQIEDMKFILEICSPLIRWYGNEDEKILYYGCTGLLTTRFLMPHLPKNITNMLCVDTDIHKIKHSNQYHFHPKIENKLVAPESWQLKTNFEHVFSFYSVDGGSDLRSLFENSYKHLKPNGDFVFVALESHSFDNLLTILDNNHNMTQEDVKKLNHDRCLKLKIKNIKDTLGAVGYSEIYCQNFERYQVFPNRKIMKQAAISYLGAQDVPDNLMDNCIESFLSEQAESGSVRYLGRNRSVVAVFYTLTFVYANKFVRRKSSCY